MKRATQQPPQSIFPSSVQTTASVVNHPPMQQSQAGSQQTTTTLKPSAEQQARQIFLIMLAVELLLVALYWLDIVLGAPVAVLHALVDLDGEGNLPTWFSSFQLALIALALGFLAFQQRKSERPSKIFLALLASVFLLWSADETAQMHERLTAFIGQRYVDWLPAFFAQHQSLVALFIVAALVLARWLWADVLAFWQTHKRASLLAIAGFGVVVLGGAILETIGYKFFLNGTTPLLYQTEVCFEEFFEMLGASLILYSVSRLALTKAAERAPVNQRLQPLLLKRNLTR
ncbi:MAG: hypothetical protein HY231_21925 [Acidobacteria bacterium]|nr:hypothetical protein [Acidobacteriota bacterium]